MTKNITAALKKYKAQVTTPEQAGDVTRHVLDSPELNYNFGGGAPLGRIVELFGPESGGKSVLAWHIAGQIQQREEQNFVVILDFERTFKADYARTAGLDLSEDKLLILHPFTGEEGFQMVEDLMKTGDVGCVIVDSLASVPNARAMDSDFGKGFSGSAALISNAMIKLNPYIHHHKVLWININQIRDDIGGFSPAGGTPTKTPGGHAPKFYASWRARVTRTQDIKSKGIVIGNGIKVRNVKNKVGPPKRVSELVLYYDKGFDPLDEYVNFITNADFDLSTVRGAWIYGNDGTVLEGEKWQGRAALREWLLKWPGALEQCKTQIVDKFEKRLASDEAEDDEESLDEEVTEEPDDWETFAANPTAEE